MTPTKSVNNWFQITPMLRAKTRAVTKSKRPMIGPDRRITKRVTILILLLTKRLHNFGILNLLNYVVNVIEQFLHILCEIQCLCEQPNSSTLSLTIICSCVT